MREARPSTLQIQEEEKCKIHARSFVISAIVPVLLYVRMETHSSTENIAETKHKR